mgnify:CR=1 FL=1
MAERAVRDRRDARVVHLRDRRGVGAGVRGHRSVRGIRDRAAEEQDRQVPGAVQPARERALPPGGVQGPHFDGDSVLPEGGLRLAAPPASRVRAEAGRQRRGIVVEREHEERRDRTVRTTSKRRKEEEKNKEQEAVVL